MSVVQKKRPNVFGPSTSTPSSKTTGGTLKKSRTATTAAVDRWSKLAGGGTRTKSVTNAFPEEEDDGLIFGHEENGRTDVEEDLIDEIDPSSIMFLSKGGTYGSDYAGDEDEGEYPDAAYAESITPASKKTAAPRTVARGPSAKGPSKGGRNGSIAPVDHHHDYSQEKRSSFFFVRFKDPTVFVRMLNIYKEAKAIKAGKKGKSDAQYTATSDLLCFVVHEGRLVLGFTNDDNGNYLRITLGEDLKDDGIEFVTQEEFGDVTIHVNFHLLCETMNEAPRGPLVMHAVGDEGSTGENQTPLQLKVVVERSDGERFSATMQLTDHRTNAIAKGIYFWNGEENVRYHCRVTTDREFLEQCTRSKSSATSKTLSVERNRNDDGCRLSLKVETKMRSGDTSFPIPADRTDWGTDTELDSFKLLLRPHDLRTVSLLKSVSPVCTLLFAKHPMNDEDIPFYVVYVDFEGKNRKALFSVALRCAVGEPELN